jgi:hypothetical protein
VHNSTEQHFLVAQTPKFAGIFDEHPAQTTH